MPNINTIAYQSAGTIQNTFPIPSLTNAIGTTETAFSLQANAFAAAVGVTSGGGVIPLSVPAASQQVGYSNVAADTWISGRPFRLRAFGVMTGGTTENMTLKLYQVPQSVLAAGTQGTVPGSNNQLASSGAVAVNSTSSNFEMTAELQWDSVSKKLTGTAKFSFAGTIVAEAEISVVTTVTANVNELNFILSWTFSASNAGNLVTLQFFEMEQV